MTPLRLKLFVAFAIIAAAVCVRLGFWQISRLHQRQARNALVRARSDSTESDFFALPHDSSMARFRRVRITGSPDYAHELIYAARTHNGSPGINFLTPFRIAGRDTAILVNRGWIYSPDAATVDAAKWREQDTTFDAYVDEFPSATGVTYATHPNIVSRLGYNIVAKSVPYPVATTYAVMIGDSVMRADRIARLTLPPLDEGPHLSYAIQWFGFALVALIGAGFVVKQSKSEGPKVSSGPPV